MVVLADSAARKLLHGAAAVARGVAADPAVGTSFGLDSLWQFIVGLFTGLVNLLVLPFEAIWGLVTAIGSFFASILSGIASAAHLLVLPFEMLWHGLQAAAAGISHGFEALWHAIGSFLASIVAGVGSDAHLLVLPFEMLWHWLQAAAAGISHGFEGIWQGIQGFLANIVAGVGSAAHLFVLPFEAFIRWLQAAAAGISHGFDSMWQGIQGFFANLLSALAGTAHGLVLPFEAFWRWLQTAAAGISSGFEGLWHNIQGLFANFLTTLAGAAHELVHPFEAFWKCLQAAVADAATGISIGFDGLWPFVRRVYANLLAALASAAHDFVPRLESFWRWLRAAAYAALPFVLVIIAVLCVVALVWFFWPFLCSGAVLVGRALVTVVCYCGHYIVIVAMGVVSGLACICPAVGQCFAGVTMRAPGAPGMLISRAAFESLPRLFFLISRLAGSVVATTIFCSQAVALTCAPLVAALFRL
ncbi:hypothetical protein GUJ93_ZPchr0008g13795 [Zizania palustris]|uniref:Uncharacterized protein n=1 Tax=Zizania palustris TaxID=103762 RepID=A0A8J5RGN7_ZIZPA|nr:hypothetical protein GUJ93_ZPchr0008g13795 [Zizania palustris]